VHATLLAACALGLAACGSAPPPVEPGPTISATPLTRVAVAEDADDGGRIVSEKGHLEPAAVDAALAPHRAALIGCYTQKVGRRSWLGGKVVLRWAVAVDGSLASVRITESDLGAWPIERCLLDIARQAVFGAPVGGPAELTIPLELAIAKPLPVAIPPTLTEDARRAKLIASQLAILDGCAKGKVWAPHGVVVTVYVGPRGRVRSVGFASATDIDDAWSVCAEKAALGWRLPESKGQVSKLALRYRPR
jgi:outer membrane biosynthesis protein TonB